MIVVIAVTFFGLDLGAVVLALGLLHRRRVQADYTDLRYRPRLR